MGQSPMTEKRLQDDGEGDARILRLRSGQAPAGTPATAAEAIEFFHDQSVEHDDPTLPKGKRGIRFVLKAEDADKLAKTPLPKLAAKNLSLYNAFNLVCEVSGLTYSFGKQQEIVIESLK